MNKTINLTGEDTKQMREFIEQQWSVLTTKCDGKQNTLIQLPNEYIKPSTDEGHFRFNEQYYWDSYFISLGIDNEKLVTGMLDNLISLFDEFQLLFSCKFVAHNATCFLLSALFFKSV